MPLKALVDTRLCQGHGVCVEEAPKVFALAEGGVAGQQAQVLVAEVSAADEAAVKNAVKYCPTQAIRLTSG